MKLVPIGEKKKLNLFECVLCGESHFIIEKNSSGGVEKLICLTPICQAEYGIESVFGIPDHLKNLKKNQSKT